MTARRRGTAATVLLSLGLIAAMVGLVAASVPLYELFCRVTGYGGAVNVAQQASAAIAERRVTVRFDANTNSALPWRFAPNQRSMEVRLGEQHLASYSAENLSDEPIIGQATYNVTPAKAGQYFSKIDCFCFTEQRLEPGQRVEMPVSFFVDPGLATDPHTGEVTTITLSYTFFRAPSAVRDGGRARGADDNDASGRQPS